MDLTALARRQHLIRACFLQFLRHPPAATSHVITHHMQFLFRSILCNMQPIETICTPNAIAKH